LQDVPRQLLEREPELAAARAVLARARAGATATLVVDAGPGIGKSALARAIAGDARSAGIEVLAAPATELGADTPLALARRLLAPLAPPLADAVALSAAVRDAAWPLAIVVDDAQWADPESIALLGRMATAVPLAIVLIGDGAATNGLPDTRVERPGGLSEAAIAKLLRAALPGSGRPFATALDRLSGGVPLLVRELIAAAVDRGMTGTPDDARRLEAVVPAAVERWVGARLARLSPDARVLTEAVAVLGTGTLERAADTAGVAVAAAAAAAGEARAAALLAPDDPLRLAQPVCAAAVAASLPAFAAARLHRCAAGALAHADGAGDGRQVAAHLLRSRPDADPWTVATLRCAARSELEAGDTRAAAALLLRAAAEPPGPVERDGVLCELATAEALAGLPSGPDRLRAALAVIAGRTERVDAWRLLALALAARGDHRDAADAACRGAAELPAGDPARDLLLADELAAAVRVPGLAVAAHERLDAIATDVVDGDGARAPALVAQVAASLAWRGERLDRVAALAMASAQDGSDAGAALAAADALVHVDDPPAARSVLHRALGHAQARGDEAAAAALRCSLARIATERAELDDADRHVGSVIGAVEAGFKAHVGSAHLIAARLSLIRGDRARAQALLARAEELAGSDPFAGIVRGMILDDAGDAAGALEAFVASGELVEAGFGAASLAPSPWRPLAAMAAYRAGDHLLGSRLAADAVDQARAAGIRSPLGRALRAAAVAQGDSPAALDLFAEAVDVLEGSPARLEELRARLDLGAGLRRAGRRAKARGELERVLATARAAGARAIEARARDEIVAARGGRGGSRPAVADVGVRALTPSERRVVDLAAVGMTSPEIAARLRVSPRTVESHLGGAYRKLEVDTREDLAARLARREDGAHP
jgi:DNA-binding CsgD family transcriptional regulator/tetratricopeptide (TPR) repeat protein